MLTVGTSEHVLSSDSLFALEAPDDSSHLIFLDP